MYSMLVSSKLMCLVFSAISPSQPSQGSTSPGPFIWNETQWHGPVDMMIDELLCWMTLMTRLEK